MSCFNESISRPSGLTGTMTTNNYSAEHNEEKKRLIIRYAFINEGSDPKAATCRSKLQSKRAKLNQEINKELRLRAGAENLFRATSNKKLRETVSLELSFVNSNLQLLKEKLAALNSSVEVYQAPGADGRPSDHIPMIPLGLKETKDVPFHDSLFELIEDHYKEKGIDYEESIAELSDLRQAMRMPSRDSIGIALLYEYYNQLYFFERRFFSPERGLGVFFEWYDSLTGVPSAQRTVAFEKACVLFNLGALHTQIGTRLERGTGEGLDGSVDNYLRAAAVFRFIVDNFTNAPSMDLAPQVLEAFILLMIAQARECLFEKLLLSNRNGGNQDQEDIDTYLEQAQEAAELSESYQRVYDAMSIELVKDYVPDSWISLVQVKSQYYRAIGHQSAGSGLTLSGLGSRPLSERTKETLLFMYNDAEVTVTSSSSAAQSNAKINSIIDIRVPKNDAERLQLGLTHLRESVLLHEESLRLQRMSRELKKRDHLSTFLRRAHASALDAYNAAQIHSRATSGVEQEDDFAQSLDPPPILASTKLQLSFGQPDFGQYPVTDLFRRIGPLSLFSAKHKWNPKREAHLRKLDDQGFGFSVRGDGPIILAGVDGGSIADLAGVREGDVIIGIGEVDVKWSTHEEVVSLIKSARNDLKLTLIQPAEKPAQSSKSMLKNMARTLPYHHGNHRGLNTASPTSTTSSSSGVSSAASQYFSGSKSSSKSCDRIHALGRSVAGGNNKGRMRRDKSLDSHVKYRTDAKSTSNNGSRGRDRTLTGRLSLAADFFHLNLMSSKERDRTTDSGTSSQHNNSNSSSSSQKRLTWNPFRTKSRDRVGGGGGGIRPHQHNHHHPLSEKMAAMALKTPSPGTCTGDDVICKNIIMRG